MECEQQVMQTWGANSFMLVYEHVLIVMIFGTHFSQ